MSDTTNPVVNIAEVPEIERLIGENWGGAYKILTPSMRPKGGSLGVNLMRIPASRAACPFHSHQREDEVFYIISGRGLLRYGDDVHQLGPGDCISCPAATGTAHQIGNPFDEDLVYLAIGPHDPDEVCTYPDNGKVLVRSLQRIGWLENVDYMDGEPDRPAILGITADDGR